MILAHRRLPGELHDQIGPDRPVVQHLTGAPAHGQTTPMPRMLRAAPDCRPPASRHTVADSGAVRAMDCRRPTSVGGAATRPATEATTASTPVRARTLVRPRRLG